MKVQKEKHFENYDTMMSVFGELDENIEKITDAFDVDVFEQSTRLKNCLENNRLKPNK